MLNADTKSVKKPVFISVFVSIIKEMGEFEL